MASPAIATALMDDKIILETYEIESILARLCSKEQVRRTGNKYAVATPLSVTSVLGEFIPSGVTADVDTAAQPVASNEAHVLTKVDRSAIDWVLPDAHISRQQEVSRERIRQIRLDLGVPASPLKNQHKSTVELYVWISKNLFRAAGLTAAEIVDASGLSVKRYQIATAMAAAGVPWNSKPVRKIGATKRLVMNFNWSLPNRELSKIWQLPVAAIANHRSRLKAGPAKWDGRGLSNRNGQRQPVDYLEALTAERVKASGRLRRVG